MSSRKFYVTLRYAVAILISFIVLFPFLWIFRLSLEETFSTLPSILPERWTLTNYLQVIRFTPFPQWIVNSIVFSGGVTLLNVVMAPMAGYALARKRIRFANLIFWVILALWIIPFQVLLVPTYLFLARIGLLDTYAGLVLPLGVEPLAVFIMRQYMINLPREYEEAAYIDGCSHLRAFVSVVLPLASPAVTAASIVTFVYTWGNLIYPLVMTSRQSMATLPVGVAGFASGTVVDWGMTMAATLLGALPTIVLFLFLNRQFMDGMTFSGGVRG